MGTPHSMVDNLLDGLVDGMQGVGKQVMSALDAPLRDIGIPSPGPHRMMDRCVDGVWDGTQTMGEGVIRALNVPVEALGIPPDLGRGFVPPGLPRFPR